MSSNEFVSNSSPVSMFRIRLATEAEIIERNHLTFLEWGEMLTLEQYLHRESYFRERSFCKESLQTWVLVDENELILASIESFAMPSLYRTLDGKEISGKIEGLTSFVVDKKFRGRGYSRKLLDAIIAEKMKESPFAFVGFSEVGGNMYRTHGFLPVPGYERIYMPLPATSQPRRASFLTRDQLRELWPTLQPPNPGDAGNVRRLRTWPTIAKLEWYWDWQDLYAQYLGQPAPTFCGARYRGSWILWYSYAEKALCVLYLRSGLANASGVPAAAGGDGGDGSIDEHSDVAELIMLAREYAGVVGLDKVTVWEEEECGATALDAAGLPQDFPATLPRGPPLAASAAALGGGAAAAAADAAPHGALDAKEGGKVIDGGEGISSGGSGVFRRSRDHLIPVILPVAEGLRPCDWGPISNSTYV